MGLASENTQKKVRWRQKSEDVTHIEHEFCGTLPFRDVYDGYGQYVRCGSCGGYGNCGRHKSYGEYTSYWRQRDTTPPYAVCLNTR